MKKVPEDPQTDADHEATYRASVAIEAEFFNPDPEKQAARAAKLRKAEARLVEAQRLNASGKIL